MYNNFIGYVLLPKEGQRVLADVLFDITNGVITKKQNIELPDRKRIVDVVMNKRPEGMSIEKFRAQISYEINDADLLTKFKGDKAQFAWAVIALMNAKMPITLSLCDIIEHMSFIPTQAEFLYHMWSDAVASYVLPYDAGAEGDFMSMAHLCNKLLIPVRDLVNLWHKTYRSYRECRSYVIFSYLQNVLRDPGIQSLGYITPLLPYSSYIAFDVSTREPLQYSIEMLDRGMAVYNSLLASGMYTDADIQISKYVRSYIEPKNVNYVPKRILAPNFNAPVCACVWFLDESTYPHSVVNVSRQASEIVTNLLSVLPSIKDRAIYNYLKRKTEIEEEYIMLQSDLWKHGVAGALWEPSPKQDLYKTLPIQGCPIKFEKNMSIANMDVAVGTADIYSHPQSLPMTTTIDGAEGTVVSFDAKILKNLPPVWFYEPTVDGKIISSADLSEFLTPSELLLEHSMPSLKYVCNLEWWFQYLRLFVENMNFTDYMFLLDIIKYDVAVRIAKVMGYRETEDDEALLRILCRAKFALSCWLFDLVQPGLGTLLASKQLKEWENTYFVGRKPSQLKQ